MAASDVTTIKVDGDIRDILAKMDALGIKAEGVGAEMENAFGDRVQPKLEKTSNLFDKLGQTISGLGLPFGETFSKMGEKIDSADTSGKKFVQTMGEVGKLAFIGIVVGAAAAGKEAIDMGEKFQQSEAKIAASSGTTIQAAQKIGNTFLDTAGKTTFSGQEIADAYGQVAGQLKNTEGHALDSKDAMKFMQSAMDMAEGSGQSLASTTSGLSVIMQEYGMNTSQAATAGDQLYQISQITNQPISTLAQTIVRLKSRLGDVTPSLSDVGTLMAFPQVASMGSRGVMTVSTAFSTLLGGGKAVTAQLKSMGVNIFNAQGKFVGMRSVIQQMGPSLSKMTDQQRDLAEKTLFSTGAEQLMGQIMQEGVAGYDKSSAAVNKVNAAHEAAEKQANTLHGSLEVLKSTVEDEGTKIGIVLIPIVTKLGTEFGKATSFLLKHKTILEVLGGVIAAVIGTMIGVAAVLKIQDYVKKMQAATKAVGDLVQKLPGMGKAAKASAAETEEAAATQKTAMEGVQATEEEGAAVSESTGGGFGPIGMIIGGIVIALVLLGTHWKKVMSDIKTWAEDAWTFIKKWSVEFALGFTILLGPVGLLLGVIIILAAHWKQVMTDIKNWSADVWHFLDSTWNNIKNDVLKAWNWIENFFKEWWPIIIGIFLGPIGLIVGLFVKFHTQITGEITKLYNDVIQWFKRMWTDVSNWVQRLVSNIVTFFSGIWGKIASYVSGVVTNTVNYFKGLPGTILTDLKQGFFGVVSWFEKLGEMFVHAIVQGIGNVGGSIASTLGSTLKGAVSHIPVIGGTLAKVLGTGGIVTQPTLAIIGEAGPEAVVPLSGFGGAAAVGSGNVQPLPAGLGGGRASGAGVNVTQNIFLPTGTPQQFAQETTWAMSRFIT